MGGKRHKGGRYLKAAPRKNPFKKGISLLLVVIALSVASFGGTLAYILTNSEPVTNVFVPAQVSCRIYEDFTSGLEKKNVSVQNTSNVPVYIRVKLLPYWYDKEKDSIVAKKAWEMVFSPESGWQLGSDGYYYYLTPVEPQQYTTDLIPSLVLKQDDVSLSREVLEIIASCIQADPEEAVKKAWSGTNGSVTDVKDGNLVIEKGA